MADWIEVPAPELLIVSAALWKQAHERLENARRLYLRGTDGEPGAPASGLESQYLLTGLARCGECGGTMTVRSRSHGRRRAHFYACTSFHHRGKAVCTNSLEMRLEDADQAILAALGPNCSTMTFSSGGARCAALDPSARGRCIQKTAAQGGSKATAVEIERLMGAIWPAERPPHWSQELRTGSGVNRPLRLTSGPSTIPS